MIGFDAVVNTLRKPALAFLAAAGLVVGGLEGAVTPTAGPSAASSLSAPAHPPGSSYPATYPSE